MTRSPEGNNPDTIVQEIDIAAPPAVVWKALTDADQLTRWLPLEAQVKPGKGGSIRMTWGEPVTEESTIEEWEPEKHLRVREVTPFGVQFEPAESKAAPPRIVDYTMTGSGGKTVLRLTHTGFDGTPPKQRLAAGALDRVDQSMQLSPLAFRGVVADCWRYQLSALGDYCENHVNQTRSLSWVRQPIQMSFAEAWSRISTPAEAGGKALLSVPGSGATASGKTSFDGLKPGDQYSFQAITGDTFSGKVLTYIPNKQFGGTVENLNGIMRIFLSYTLGRPDIGVWLARYSKDAELVSTQQWHKLFEVRWANALANTMV